MSLVKPTEHPPRSGRAEGGRAERLLTLGRFRSPLAAWLQMVALIAGCLQPAPMTHAVYIDDSGAPGYWLPLNSGDIEPPSGPNLSQQTDSEGNPIGDPAWRVDFFQARDSGQIVFWTGGTFTVDGAAIAFGGQWVLATTENLQVAPVDADQDGLPDALDDYPNDATNNSFYWSGGQFTINNIYHAFRSGWYSGHTTADSNGTTFDNGNSVPTCLMSWFDPSASHPGVYLHNWGGVQGAFVNGQRTDFPPCGYWTTGWVDADNDQIPAEFDPDDHDPWNNTYYSFPGGDFWVDGVLTALPAATYPGIAAENDSDADGIPNPADQYPDSNANNSAFWPGGPLYVRGVLAGSVEARMHRADSPDTDGDGLPDDVDPYANNAGNFPIFWFGGGTYLIDNQQTEITSGWYESSLAIMGEDSDGDGMPNELDPYPGDSLNHSDCHPYVYWIGGTFTINDSAQTFETGYYVGTRNDQDSDGLPDFADTAYPSDPNNGNYVPPPTFQWNGGSFYVDGWLQQWEAGTYEGDGNDSDGDGLPNALDQYDNALYPNNNSDQWTGGIFRIDGVDTQYPYPDANGNPVALWYQHGSPDDDQDGIPDVIDPYPGDHGNNEGFFWPAESQLGNNPSFPAEQYVRRIQNLDWTFFRTHYSNWALDSQGVPIDNDLDGIPDVADPLPIDFFNENDDDTDGDGIPDRVEAATWVLDWHNPEDAVNIRGDGITYLQAYQYNVAHATTYPIDQAFDTSLDSDGDGLSNVYEIFNGLDIADPEDAAYTLTSATPSPYDPYVLNIERKRYGSFGLPSDHSITSAEEFAEVTGQTWADLQLHLDNRSSAEADWDGDYISNRDEILLLGTNPRVFNAVVDEPSAPTDLFTDTMRTLIATGAYLPSGIHLHVGVTTLEHFGYLVTPCGCGLVDDNNIACEGIHCANVQNPGGCQCHAPSTPPPSCTCTSCPHDNTCSCGANCDNTNQQFTCGCTNSWCKRALCVNASTTNPPAAGDCGCTAPPQNDCACGAQGCQGQQCPHAVTPAPTSDCGCSGGNTQPCGCSSNLCYCGDASECNNGDCAECACSYKQIHGNCGCSDYTGCTFGDCHACHCPYKQGGCGCGSEDDCQEGEDCRPTCGCSAPNCPKGTCSGATNSSSCACQSACYCSGVEKQACDCSSRGSGNGGLPCGCSSNSEVVVYVTSPLASAVTNNVLDVSIDSGHTFLSVFQGGKKTSTWSFGPINHSVKSLNLWQGGVAGTGSFHTGHYDVEKHIPVADSEATKIVAEIARLKASPPLYSGGYNCTSSCVQLVGSNATHLPSGVGTVVWKLFGLGQLSNPHHLGRALQGN